MIVNNKKNFKLKLINFMKKIKKIKKLLKN